MPCRTDGMEEYTYRENASKLNKVEAMLCAVLSALDKPYPNGFNGFVEVRKKIDYTEAGISENDLVYWWHDHQAKDRARKADEARERRVKEVRKAGLAKLNSEERKALGL